MSALKSHLQSGLTHMCRCWAIQRSDGVTLGFTDHDQPLVFAGIQFVADGGMTAKALSSAAGLSVDNTEAVGILSDAAITESDIAAGRYDDADVTIWQVQWDDIAVRQVQFRGKIGEITRSGQSFQADIRGLTELLNQPQGRAYLRHCSAVLGDGHCGVDLDNPLFAMQLDLDQPSDGQVFDLPAGSHAAQWFVGGVLRVASGTAQGLSGVIKADETHGPRRQITLWEPIRQTVAVGDKLQVIAGCNKRIDTCGAKFNNVQNFQGFPHIPGDDWLLAVPRSKDDNAGGALL